MSRSSSPLWAAASLAVLLFAGWQTVAILSHEPAFNRTMRVLAPTGSRVPRFREAMFDRAEYFSSIATEWYYDSDGARGGDEEARETALRFRKIAADSLRYNPGDANTWMLMARAEAALGNAEEAMRAVRVSHDLGPRNAALALNRLYFLASFMSDPDMRDLAQAEIPPALVQDDLATLRSNPALAPSVTLIANRPEIAAFAGDDTARD